MALPAIAILHYSAPPVIGGVESTMAAHAKLLADRGYPVKLVAGRGEPADERVPVCIIPEMDSKHPEVLATGAQLERGEGVEACAALADRIRAQLEACLADVDVCIVHNAATLHKNLPLTQALFDLSQRGLPTIAWCHDLAWNDPLYTGALHDGQPWDLLRTRWPGVQYVVVSGARHHELAHLLRMSEDAIRVIPPGVDPIELLGIGPVAAQWVRKGLLDGAPLLLLPARVTRRKNIELGIQVTAALVRMGHPARLLVMGPLGPHNPSNAAYLAELDRQRAALGLGDSVVFLSQHAPVDDSVRRDLYLLADALFMPSAREGFGIPVLEAGIARLPVFTSDIPPFHESAGEWASYFNLADEPAKIARLISEALEIDARYQLRQRVLGEYAWPRLFVERIEPLLRETCPNETLNSR
ncbi:MAG: glycosyltransferase family 4 protein [Rudaea sp.]